MARTLSLVVAAALVVLPVAQERFSQRSDQTARASSARVDRSGVLPSSESGSLRPAEGRTRAGAR